MHNRHEHIKKYRLDGVQRKDTLVVPQKSDLTSIEPISTPPLHQPVVLTTPPPAEQSPIAPAHSRSIALQLACIVVGVFLFSFAPIRLFELGSIISAKAQTNSERFNNLVSTIKDKDYISAQTYITLIDQDLTTINDEFIKSGQKNIFINTYLPIQDHSTTAENIFSIINDSSRIARDITPIMSELSHTTSSDLSDANRRAELIVKLKTLNTQLTLHRPALDRLAVQVEHIDADRLPAEIRDSFLEVKNQVKTSQDFFDIATETIDLIPTIFGLHYDQKYLLLLQNNTELRPTGGFIGSYGIITIRDAQVKNIFIDSIYNPDGQIQKDITPPAPLQKITQTWAMRDANWSPDFPTSVSQIQRMYELEGGFTPDGVVAIDTFPIIEILRLFGPIPVDNGQTQITADNFLTLTQYKTSIDIDDAHNPKKFLADLGPIVMDKIMKADPDTQKKIMHIIKQSLAERHIQVILPHEKIMPALDTARISGRILTPDTADYFMYVNSNIGGMKTNHEIIEHIHHEIRQEKSHTTHTATIERTHTGIDTWPSGINYAYMRFYLPENAQITDISGLYMTDSIQKNPDTGILYLKENPTNTTIHTIDSQKELGKRVYGAWAVIKPGESQNIRISYRLNHGGPYSLYIQKQAGVIEQMTQVSHYSPSGLHTDQTSLREDYLYR